jgi:hypothetical protein
MVDVLLYHLLIILFNSLLTITLEPSIIILFFMIVDLMHILFYVLSIQDKHNICIINYAQYNCFCEVYKKSLEIPNE